ncbi:hypothetical protein PRZ48_005522 [Zasmidium cellare]|uniref:Uncharacterized protein n=1 Tax=Zasmidium cellare TaxID=395010 RepID=A0ABR0EKK1_ZASCE|nr:hypothetical protein PRZ48_005522 [Zasmidium cellare]
MEHSPGEEQLLRLCNSVNLATLNVEFTWTWEPECRRIMTHLKRVLLSCPNLKSLTLDVSQPRSGCVLYSEAQEYVGCGFEPGDKLPPLEELNLIKYEFGRAPQGTLPGGEIDFWVQAFDWSKLKTLKTGYEEFALKVASQLTALEEVHLLGSWWNSTMPDFLSQVASSLRTISAPTLRQVSLEGLLHHSGTLETLHLHRDEDYGHTWMADCVDIDSLRRLRFDCPCLRELTVDIARSGSWPLLTLDALAAFPKLRVLYIWFELGLQDFDHPLSPMLTFETARYVSGYLQSRNSSLDLVHLHSGSPPSIGFGYPSVEAFWPGNNSTSFVCEMSETCQNSQEHAPTVTCPILEQRERDFRRWEQREKNTRRPISTQIKDRLQKTLKPNTYRRRKAAEAAFTGIGTARRRRNEAAQVAHHGPTPVSRWKGHYY